MCEECGHSTSDPEDHFRHLQQNHPFSPALARCHDKRQFKFHENASDRSTAGAQNDADTEYSVQNPVGMQNKLETSQQALVTDNHSRGMVGNEVVQDINSEHVSEKTDVGTSSEAELELSMAIQSVQSELNKMGKETVTHQPVHRPVATGQGGLRVNSPNIRETAVMRERTSGYSPQKFPWKSPRKSPKKMTQSPQKSKVTKSPIRLGQWQTDSFRIYEDVPQYDIENRRVQKLKQYGGVDYYKSKTNGLSESPVYKNNQNVENVQPKQIISQEIRNLGQKQPLGNLTQNTQHLK